MVSPVNMTQVQHSTGLVYVEPIPVKKSAPDFFLTSVLILKHLNEVDPTAHTRVTLEVYSTKQSNRISYSQCI